MRKLALAAFLVLPAGVLAASQEEIFEKAFSMEGVSRISVQNVNGRIEATAWDRPYLKVRAVKKASGGEAEETLRLTEIRVRKIGEEIRLETVNPRRHKLFGFLDFGWHNARVDYELHFPAATAARLETCNGQVQATGFDNSLSCDVVNGSVAVAFARASSVRYDLQTVNGRIEGDFELAVEGKHGPKEARGSYNGGSESLRCETVNGSIRLKTR